MAKDQATFNQVLKDIQSGKRSGALYFSDQSITDEDLENLLKALAHNTTLTSLNLDNNQIGDAGARALAMNTILTSLNLNNNQIGDAGAQALAQNTTLTSLELNGNKIRDAGAEVLAKNTTLTSLNLESNQIDNAGAHALAKNTTLTSLNLRGNQIRDAGAQALARNTTLTELDLSINPIGVVGAQALAKNATLTSLNLAGNRISKIGAQALARSTTLTSLNLDWNQIRDAGAQALAMNTTLVTLNFKGNQIGDAGAQALARNTTLTELDLYNNQIGDAGAQALAKNITLTSLNLPHNQIGDAGAQALARNTTLTELDLAWNQIGDAGAQALAMNTILTELNLIGNQIGDAGAQALAMNTTLVRLNLIGNQISEAIASRVNQAVKRNRLQSERFLKACTRGDVDTVRSLLNTQQVSPYVAARILSQETGLHLAIRQGQAFVVRRQGKASVVRWLSETFPSLLGRRNRHGQTPRQMSQLRYQAAIRSDPVDIYAIDVCYEVEVIFEPQLIDQVLNVEGETFLHIALRTEHPGLLTWVLSKQPNWEVANQAGITPVSYLKQDPRRLQRLWAEHPGVRNNLKDHFDELIMVRQAQSLVRQLDRRSDLFRAVNDYIYQTVKQQQLSLSEETGYYDRQQQLLHQQLTAISEPNPRMEYVVAISERLTDLFRQRLSVDPILKVLSRCVEPAELIDHRAKGSYPLFYRLDKAFIVKKEDRRLLPLNQHLGKLKEVIQWVTQAQGGESGTGYSVVLPILNNLYELYQSYQVQILALGQGTKEDETARLSVLKDLIQVKWQLISDEHPGRYLKASVLEQITPSEGESTMSRGQTEYGSHIVRLCQLPEAGVDMHVKYHDADQSPCFQGVELMISSLYTLLAGSIYGIAPTTLVKLAGPVKQPLLAIASKTAGGINLLDFLDNHLSIHPEYLDQMDMHSYSAMVVTSLLTNPQDGKPDNYMVQFQKGDEGRVRVVGIDNDYAFAAPVIKRHAPGKGQGHYTEVRSVFYFFPQMQDTLDPKFRDHFLTLSPELLLIQWLSELSRQNQRYEQLVSSKRFTKAELEGLHLPIQFGDQDILKLYHKLILLQQKISEDASVTHQGLFEHLYPRLARYYQTFNQLECPNGDHPILGNFYNLYSASAASMEEAAEIAGGERIQANKTMSCIAAKTAKRDAYLIRTHGMQTVMNSWLKHMDFSRTELVGLEKEVLLSLHKLSDLSQLTLCRSQMLDDEVLSELVVSFDRLETLCLVECHQVTVGGILRSLSAYKRKYKRRLLVGLEDCDQIQLKEYRRLHAEGCLGLLYRDSVSQERQIIKVEVSAPEEATNLLHRLLSHHVLLSEGQLRFLCALGADLNAQSNGLNAYNGYTAVHMVSRQNDVVMLRRLMRVGGEHLELKKRDRHKDETAFGKAWRYRLFRVCEVLSPDRRDEIQQAEQAHRSASMIQRNWLAYSVSKANPGI